MIVFLLIGMCVNFALFASGSELPDVHIMHISKHMLFYRFYHLSRADGVCVECSDGKMRNICDVLEDQILAAFCFKPSVPKRYWGCSELWDEDVRDVSCDEGGFFSQEMRVCFSEIERRREGNNLLKRITVKALGAFGHVFPEGMTRRWSVARRGFPGYYLYGGEIMIYFKDKGFVIHGSSPFKTTKHDAIRSRSLLGIKRAQLQTVVAPLDNPLYASSVPSLSDFLKWGALFSQECVGLVYFPKGGGQVSALFDLTGVTNVVCFYHKQKRKRKEETFFESVRGQILSGYVVKYDAEELDCAKINTSVVREALCYKSCFLSQVLRLSIQEHLCNFWQNKRHVVSGGGWGGFTTEHFKGICGTCNALQWELMDKDVFLRQLNDADAQERFEEKVFTLIQGENVVVQGTPFDAAPEAESKMSRDSLGAHFTLEYVQKNRKG